jgi:hypothetical protein
MSYQTIPVHRKSTPATSRRWILVAVITISLSAIALMNDLFMLDDALDIQPTQIAPSKLEHNEAKREMTSNSPLYDFETLASAESLQAAPTLTEIESEDVASAPVLRLIGSSEQAITAYVGSLRISALSDSKAVINGVVFRFGDYIDPEQKVKLYGLKEGELYFEAHDQLYHYEENN